MVVEWLIDGYLTTLILKMETMHSSEIVVPTNHTNVITQKKTVGISLQWLLVV